MKIVFMGTPAFAVPSLKALIKNGYDVVSVVTQPDRPKGRGYKTVLSPVKETALANNIEVFQPIKIREKESVAYLDALAPDLLITAAFGQILSAEVLGIPKYGCINVHASLLPKYRGAAPIQWAVINGERTTGITTMLTDIGLDTGDILLSRETAVGEAENAEELYVRLADLGAEVLLETLEALKSGSLKRIKQDEEKASYYPMIKKELAQIDWSGSSEMVYNLIRGMYSWPMAYTHYGTEKLKILSARLTERRTQAEPGTVICSDPKNGLVVACGDGKGLFIDKMLAQSAKPMTSIEYLRGKAIPVGTKFTFLMTEK